MNKKLFLIVFSILLGEVIYTQPSVAVDEKLPVRARIIQEFHAWSSPLILGQVSIHADLPAGVSIVSLDSSGSLVTSAYADRTGDYQTAQFCANIPFTYTIDCGNGANLDLGNGTYVTYTVGTRTDDTFNQSYCYPVGGDLRSSQSFADITPLNTYDDSRACTFTLTAE